MGKKYIGKRKKTLEVDKVRRECVCVCVSTMGETWKSGERERIVGRNWRNMKEDETDDWYGKGVR